MRRWGGYASLLLLLVVWCAPAAAAGDARAAGPRLTFHARAERVLQADHHERVHGVRAVRDQPFEWMTQQVDHFDDQNEDTWQQRFFVNEALWDGTGPVFLYIGGEGRLTGWLLYAGEPYENARTHKALLVALEHRFYGDSMPTPGLTTEELRFLTERQALEDLRAFVAFIRTRYHLDAATPWVAFGGSYPGCLSAWVRTKYPALIAGAVASSAPVRAKADFFEYDQVLAASAGATCSQRIVAAREEVERELARDAAATKALFTCSGVSDVEFLYVLADSVAYAIQYDSARPGSFQNAREFMCATIDGSMEGYRAYFAHLLDVFASTCVELSLSDEYLTYTTPDGQSGMRQWMYQSCTSFGFFQTAPPTGSLRSSLIDVAWHLDLCRRVFGQPLVPDADAVNAYFGSNTPETSRIVFPNGHVDPWHALGVQSTLGSCGSVVPLLIPDTAHVADLYPADASDSSALTMARVHIANLVSHWVRTPPLSTQVQQCASHACCGHGLCTGGVCFCDVGWGGEDCCGVVPTPTPTGGGDARSGTPGVSRGVFAGVVSALCVLVVGAFVGGRRQALRHRSRVLQMTRA